MTIEGRRRAIQVAAFAGILVVIDVLLGSLLAGLGDYADPKSSPIGLLEAVRKDQNAEVLVLGSSRANHHMDSGVLASRLGKTVHNAGLDGQSVVFARAVQEFSWDVGLEPELFVLQVDAFDVMSWEPKRAHVVTHYLASMPATRETFEREGYNVRVKLLSRTFRFNSLTVQLVANRLRYGRHEAGEDSFIALTGLLESRDLGVQGVPGRWTGSSRDVSSDALGVLRQFVEAATAAGSRVALVTGPYVRNTPVTAEERAALSAIAEVASSGGAVLLEIDERRFPVLDDPALFSDPSHLNAEGAQIYSEILARLLQESLGL